MASRLELIRYNTLGSLGGIDLQRSHGPILGAMTMSTITPTSILPDPPWVPSPLYRFTLDQYEAMVASGAFTAKDRFHLINGFLVAKMTQNDPHSTADELCGEALESRDSYWLACPSVQAGQTSSG